MKKIVFTLAAALILSACANDTAGTTAATSILQDSYEAGKTAAINTGVSAVTGKLTGSSTSTMTEIAKQTATSGKNAAITKATSSLTGSTATPTTGTTGTTTNTGSFLDNILK